MPYCKKCGLPLDTGIKICPSCGAEYREEERDPFDGCESAFGTPEKDQRTDARKSDSSEGSSDRGFAVLAYFWILWLLPLIFAGKSEFARFHANQGLVLFLFECILSVAVQIVSVIVTAIFVSVGMSAALPALAFSGLTFGIGAIFSIIGIVNAANGRIQKLPLIGNITLIK